MSAFPLLDYIDRIYVINLPFRADRRMEMAAQLARVGLNFDHPKVQLFTASRPEDAGNFPNIGTRGCFESHLGVLRNAKEHGHNCILILEDDADFSQRFCASDATEAAIINAENWDFFYFGSVIQPTIQNGFFEQFTPERTLLLAHATLLRRPAISGLVPYLETMMARDLGDPKGGPMHLDGAYNWFRREHPEMKTMATTTQWMIQRASKTDIHDTGWKERLPFISLARRLKNRLARRQR